MIPRRPGVPNKTAPAQPRPVAPEPEIVVDPVYAAISAITADILAAARDPRLVELIEKASGYADELLDDARDLPDEARVAGLRALALVARRTTKRVIQAVAAEADAMVTQGPSQTNAVGTAVAETIDYDADPFALDDDKPTQKSGEQIHRELEAQKRAELLKRKRGGK